jgi:hypothetical protein
VENEGGRSTELAEQERGITALLGRIQLFERRIEAHRKSLVARMRWFTRFCPEVAGAEARWTAERLDAVGAHDKAVEVLQWALSTAPGARGSAGTCEIPLLRSELADRLAVQGRHDEELAHRVSNFEEDPTWPSYRRVCEVLQELGGLDTDRAKRLLRQLPNIALSFSRTNLALRIALDLEQQQRIQAIVRDAGVEELDKLLLARAVEYISKFEPETALRLLRPRVRPLMQEKRRAEEIEEGVARLARLLRGLTSSVEGWEAWADYMQDLESEVGESRKWWRQLNLWE